MERTDSFNIAAEAKIISDLAHASAEGMDLLENRVRLALERCQDATEQRYVEAITEAAARARSKPMAERTDTERIDWLSQSCKMRPDGPLKLMERWEVRRIAGSHDNPFFVQLTVSPWGHDHLREAIDDAIDEERKSRAQDDE